MKPMIAIFKFTISNGRSIGPERLQQLWAKACRTTDVGVGRAPGTRDRDKPTYALYGRQNLENLSEIERTLRASFDAMDLHVSLFRVDRI